ncbi:MAG: hypothetical protein Q9214_006109, partial [Letrouitia sp. 1 TL-2023]
MGVVGNQPSTSKSDLHFASETVVALLSSSQPRVWDQDRANQLNAMRPEELPCLDSKWVRSNAKRVLAFFSYLLERSGWHFDQDSSSNVLLVWQSFAKALGEAASKEVKVSAETMNAVAQIVSTLKRFVQQNRESNRGDAEPMQAIVMLVQETIAKVGTLPFLEKRLTQKSSEDLFEVAETPSKRHSRYLETVNSPIAHILRFLVCNVQNDQIKENYRLAIGELIEIALRGSTSRRTQLSVLRELSKLQVSADATCQKSRVLLWQQIAQYAEKGLASPNPRDSQGNSPQFLNHDYTEVISILDVGLRQTSDEVFESWKRLTRAATQELRNECGDKEVWRIVTEPLSTAIHEEASRSCNSLLIQCGTLMLETFQWPGSCQTLEQARELLGGPDLFSNKACTAEPFGSFYAMIGDLLEFNYSHLQSMPPKVSVNLIRAIARFISSCPLSLKAVVLKKVQNQLAVWVEDSRQLLTTLTASSWTEELLNAVEGIWINVILAVKSFPKMDSSTLASIETLIAAGLNSKHQKIVSDTIKMWNETFGFAAQLVYPPVVRSALMRLRPMTDMKLPTSPNGDLNEIMSSPIFFAESQDEGPAQQALSLPIQPIKVVSEEKVISQAPQRLFSPNIRSKFTLPPFDSHVSPQAPKTVARALLRLDDPNSRCAITDLIEHQLKGKENQQRDITINPGTGTLPTKTYGNRPRELLLVGKQSLAVSLLEDAGNSPDFPPDNLITDELLENSPTPRAGRREPTEPNLLGSSATPSFQPLLPSSRIDRYQELPKSEQTNGRIANVSESRDDTDDF